MLHRRPALSRFLRRPAWRLSRLLSVRAKRTLDLVLSSLMIVVLSPVLCGIFLLLSVSGPAFLRTPMAGRWCSTFDVYAFRVPAGRTGRWLTRLGIVRLPVLFNIVRGDMSIIGPRGVRVGELLPRRYDVRHRYDVRPGLVCLWWTRRRANIAYGEEAASDREYAETHDLCGDLGIALRAIPAALYGKPSTGCPARVSILGVSVDNLSMDEAVSDIVGRLEGSPPSQVCFANADCLNRARDDADYLETLTRADLVLADGIGMKLAGKILGASVQQNVNGTDLFPLLCQALSGTGHGIFLLGGRPDAADGVKRWVLENQPGVTVSGCHHGYFSRDEEQNVIDEISTSGASLLLVAMGAPRQDVWVRRHLDRLGVRVGVGVGGLFDFYSGLIPRAPQWVREIGMEWFYRFLQEPRRMWRRYFLGNAIFLAAVLRERFGRGAAERASKPPTEILG